jgi:hypothetical protein
MCGYRRELIIKLCAAYLALEPLTDAPDDWDILAQEGRRVLGLLLVKLRMEEDEPLPVAEPSVPWMKN